MLGRFDLRRLLERGAVELVELFGRIAAVAPQTGIVDDVGDQLTDLFHLLEGGEFEIVTFEQVENILEGIFHGDG